VRTLAAPFEVDSNYGRWPEEVTTNTGRVVIGGRDIPYVASTRGLPNWKALGADLGSTAPAGRLDTNSQALTDQPMQDRRDSWAAAETSFPLVRRSGTGLHLAGTEDHREGLPRSRTDRQRRRAESADRAGRQR
jgi:hypothetical protein